MCRSLWVTWLAYFVEEVLAVERVDVFAAKDQRDQATARASIARLTARG
jgi:hypothetical protein